MAESCPQCSSHHNGSQPDHISARMAKLRVNQSEAAVMEANVHSGKDYDIFLVGREGDELLYKLRDFLTHWVSHVDGRPLRVLLEHDLYPHLTERLDLVERALQLCHRFFILHSVGDFQPMSKSSDLWHKFTRSQAVVNNILQKGAIVVITENESIVADGFFASFIDFKLSRLFNGESLRSCENVNLIAPEQLNQRELKRLQALCSDQSGQPISLNNEPSAARQLTLKGQIIEREFHKLSGSIDPENGLLGSLFAKEVIDFREFDRIKKELKSKSFVEVNEELLRKIMWMGDAKIEAFIQALMENNQSYIVEYLNSLPVSD